MAIYVNFNDKIKGGSKADKHVDWVEVTSFQTGLGRSVSSVANNSQRSPGAPSIGEVVLTKGTDKASTLILKQALAGGSIGLVTIDFTQTNANGLQTFLRYKLSDCIFSSYNVSSAGDRPNEAFSLNFTELSVQYTGFDGDKVEPGAEVKYSLEESKTT